MNGSSLVITQFLGWERMLFSLGSSAGGGIRGDGGGLSGLGVCFIFPRCAAELPPAPLEDRPGL